MRSLNYFFIMLSSCFYFKNTDFNFRMNFYEILEKSVDAIPGTRACTNERFGQVKEEDIERTKLSSILSNTTKMSK